MKAENKKNEKRESAADILRWKGGEISAGGNFPQNQE